VIQASQISSASFDVQRRAKGFHCYQRGDWVYVETEPEKDDRGVHFDGLKIECFSSETGEQCPANIFGVVCAHSFAANRRKKINAKRRRTIAMKKQGVRAA
jgi:hypothetical protein